MGRPGWVCPPCSRPRGRPLLAQALGRTHGWWSARTSGHPSDPLRSVSFIRGAKAAGKHRVRCFWPLGPVILGQAAGREGLSGAPPHPGPSLGGTRCHFWGCGMSSRWLTRRPRACPSLEEKGTHPKTKMGHFCHRTQHRPLQIASGSRMCFVVVEVNGVLSPPSHRLGWLCGWVEPSPCPVLRSSWYLPPVPGLPCSGCRTCASSARHGGARPTQPVLLRLLLPRPQQGQGSWGQAEGEVFHPALTLGNVDAPQFLSCKRRRRKSGWAPKDASRIK